MQKQRQKKVCIILITMAVLISAITFGVVSFMNSPKMKMVSIIQKIPKIKKGNGTYTIDANVHVSEGDIAIGIQNGTLVLTRETKGQETEGNNFLEAQGIVHAKTNKESMLRLGAKYINGEKGEWELTNQFLLKSLFLNQQASYQLEGVIKNELAKIFVITANENVVQEGQGESLQTFLLEGYEPKIGEEQNKPTITITKSEIEVVVHKMEEKVRVNRQRFIELAQSRYQNMERSQIEKVATYLADGNITKNIFPQITDFYFKAMFEEKAGNMLYVETEFKCIGMTTILEKRIEADIVVKTSMNYSIST